MPKRHGRSEKHAITLPQSFYDDGGPAKPATAGLLTALTFTPKSGEAIEVTFSELDLGDGVLYIYDGQKKLNEDYDDLEDETTYSRPSGTPLYTLRGNTRPTALIHATGSDGALTFVYEGKSKPGAGWVAEVKSAEKRSIDQLPPSDPAGSVWMHPGNRTVEIGTEALKFYDDGGPTANIGKNFSGSVTFVPKTPGQVIRLTFQQLDLFNTSTTSYNDELKIYSGRSATDSKKLLRTLLKDPTPITFLSPESDGTLTVSLLSKTGLPKPGFVAEVQAVTPEAMRFVSATTSSPKTLPALRAGATDQGLLTLMIQTDGLKTPLSLEGVTFDLTGTEAGLVKELALYAGTTITPSQRLGVLELTESGTSAVLRLDASKPHLLSYGVNTFTIAASIGEQARSGQALSLRATDLQLSGSAQRITSPATASTTISNAYASQKGTQVIRVFDAWTFTATMSGSHYAGGHDDQITTFLPGKEGELVEINFADFHVYYNTASYGAKGRFEIYAGKDTRGKLLWKLDDKTFKTQPTFFRSDSEDGALTIVFNPKESTPTYLGKGWTATVRSQKPAPQRLEACEVSQASTATSSIGGSDQEFLDFTLVTAGQLTPKTLDKLQLHVTGGATAFTKLRLYSLPAPKDYANRTLLGEVTPSSEDPSLSLTTLLTLPEGKSYYVLTADISDAVSSGTALDLRLDKLTLSGAEEAVEKGDPAGSRVAERLYLLQPGANETINVTEPLRFLDAGGATGKIPKEFQGRVTFKPREGEVIRIHFKKVGLAHADVLSFYHGTVVAKEHLARQLKGSRVTTTDIVSTAEDGSMTVDLTTGKYTSGDGWDIEVSSIRPASMKVTTVTLHPVTPAPRLLPGTKGVQLLRMDIDVEGEYGSADLTSLTIGELFPAETTPWATLRLYDTQTETDFSRGIIVGSASPSSTAITVRGLSYQKAGTYHLYLAVDVAPEAQLTETTPQLSLLPQSVTINGKERTLPQLDSPIALSLSQGVHGTFVVGNSPEAKYKTLMQAAEDLRERGIDGAVTLQLLPGRYEEHIHLKGIPGLSETNRLVIEPREKGSQVTFENKHYKAIDYGDDKLGYFTLDGISYVTLRDLQFITQASGAPALVQLQNGSQHVTLEGCRLSAPRRIQHVEGAINLVFSHRGTSPIKDNHHLTLRRCHFEGGYKAVDVAGLTTVNLPLQRGLTIDSCTFSGQGSKVIYANEVQELKIRGNILQVSGEADANFYGIDATLTDGAEISGNRLHFGQIMGRVSSVYGISLRHSRKDNPARAKARIFNNELILQANTEGRAVYGIEIAYPQIISLEILHNSVLIYGTSTNKTTAPVAIHPSGGGEVSWLTVKNNLFQNEASGYIYHFTPAAKLTHQSISENAYYSKSGSIATYEGKELTSTLWKTTLSDLSSREVQTEFADPQTSLLPKSFAKLTFARSLSQVPKDLLGKDRKKYSGAVGAYESVTTGLPALSDGYPQPISSAGKITGLRVKLSDFGRLHYLVLSAEATAPTLDQLQGAPLSPTFAPEVEQTLTIDGLDEALDYRFYYLPQALSGTEASEVKFVEITGKLTDLSPADFEETALGSNAFAAGSWKFSGVEVVTPSESYSRNSKHALKLAASATIELKNKRQPFVHDGFYLHASAPLMLTATGAAGAVTTKTFPSTAGKWYYVSLRDLGAFTSLTLTGDGVTYLDDFGGAPQPLAVSTTNQETPSGQAVTLTATVQGGVWPYSFRWENARGETLATELSHSFTPERSASYRLTVTDSWGASQEVSQQVLVRGAAAVATFEDLALQPNSNWHGEISTEPGKDFINTTFFSGSYAFTNSNWEKIKTWGGFAYANQTGTGYQTLFPDQFNSAVGAGARSSKTYGIAYTLGAKTEVTVTHAEQAVIPGMYLTNSAWVKEFAKSGVGIVTGQAGLKAGDYFLLKVTASPSGKTLEIPLIDYRDSDPREHYLLEDWQWVDLSSLGAVSKLSFSLEGSRKNQAGLVIPAYFCFDDFGSEAPATDASTQALAPGQSQQLDLAKAFADAGLPVDATKPAHYELVSVSPNAPFTPTLSDASLQLLAQGEGEGTILVMRRQGAKRDYLRQPIAVSKTTPVDEATLQQQIQLYPNPATSEIRLQVDGAVAIYSLAGTCLFQTKSYRAGEVINVSSWPQGMYLVRTYLGTIRFLKH